MRDGVVCEQDAHEVFGMLLTDIFDAEIVNDKAEGDRACAMRLEMWTFAQWDGSSGARVLR